MKKVFITTLISSLISTTALATCLSDQKEIQDQIKKKGSIITHAYKEFSPVKIIQIQYARPNPSDSRICLAYANNQKYEAGWIKGDWKGSILATRIYSTEEQKFKTDLLSSLQITN